jgi:hypothetical protein
MRFFPEPGSLVAEQEESFEGKALLFHLRAVALKNSKGRTR